MGDRLQMFSFIKHVTVTAQEMPQICMRDYSGHMSSLQSYKIPATLPNNLDLTFLFQQYFI